MSTTITSIERDNFDYASAFANTQSSNPTIVAELTQAYTLIAQNLGISVFDFLQILQNKGNSQEQAVYLVAQLNSVRPRNALLGVMPNLNTSSFIQREIAA